MTVVVLTSGTSWSAPPDWSSTNQIETWGSAGGGGAALFSDPCGSGSGGSGGYSSVSNVAGLSGSVTINFTAAGTGGPSGGHVSGGAGGPTWFNGATQAASTVSANGGSGGAGSGGSTSAGGAGATTTGATGTVKTAGSAGAGNAGSGHGTGGAAGAPGPDGLGAAGSAGAVGGVPGAGGTGDAGLGGAGGAAPSATGAGNPGAANANGGGGGSGAGTGTGGAGGFPGGGGGGTTANSGNSGGGDGAGGQIRITYTPAAGGGTQLTESMIDEIDLFDRYVSARQRLSTNHLQFTDWSHAPMVSDNAIAMSCRAVELSPQRRYGRDRLDYSSTIQNPRPLGLAIPSCVFDLVPETRGSLTRRYDYRGWVDLLELVAVPGPLPSSRSFGLPPVGAQTKFLKTGMYQGAQASPTPGNITPVSNQTFLPLIGVGSFGP